MTDTEETFGREPVQIVELIQPKCGNIHGVLPCQSTQTGDRKCFNTRGTCRDPSNYRGSPAGHLVSDIYLERGGTIASGDLTRTSDLFAAFDVEFTDTASGVIYEQGDATTGIYLGVTSGNIVFRAGDGASGAPANAAKVSVAIGDLSGRQVTLYAAVDVSANSVSLWSYDATTRKVSVVGTNTAAGSFTSWADTDGGAIGEQGGSGIVAGEDATDFDGKINSANFYDSTAAPDMTAEFALSLFFARGKVAEQRIDGAPYIIPSLQSVSTSPSKLNLAGADPNASGLGNRALCTIKFADHPYNDIKVDPYLSDRTYDPLLQGAFWTKWMARNKYRVGMVANIYEGYKGQSLSAMRRRQYFLDKVNGPTAGGSFTMYGKDILARVEDRKAQAPVASPGELYADITDAETSIEVAGALVSEYPDSGTLRIGLELMTYSAVATSANGITFTVTQRGSDGTEAVSHGAEDGVQECLRYTGQRVDDIARDLLSRAGVSYSMMDFANWQTEVSNYLSDYLLTTIISKPTGVKELLSELQEQSLFGLWWDEYGQLIKLKAVRAVTTVPDLLSQENNILAGSFSIEEMPRQRASRVWISYTPELWTESLDDEGDFKNNYLTADPVSEGDTKYGEASIRKIFSRWLPTGLLAFNTGSKIITRYVEVPRKCTFNLDAKDRTIYGVGDAVRIGHHLDVDETGAHRNATWTITSYDEVEYGRTVKYTAEDTTLYGKTFTIQAPGAADYDPSQTYTTEAFIGDANGLLSDGTECARIT